MIKELLVIILLTLGVGVELICCAGLLAMRDAFDRLHAIGPGNILPPIFFSAAIVIQEGFSQAGIKAILIALTLLAASPVVSHATARAAWVRAGRPRKEDAK